MFVLTYSHMLRTVHTHHQPRMSCSTNYINKICKIKKKGKLRTAYGGFGGSAQHIHDQWNEVKWGGQCQARAPLPPKNMSTSERQTWKHWRKVSIVLVGIWTRASRFAGRRATTWTTATPCKLKAWENSPIIRKQVYFSEYFFFPEYSILFYLTFYFFNNNNNNVSIISNWSYIK